MTGQGNLLDKPETGEVKPPVKVEAKVEAPQGVTKPQPPQALAQTQIDPTQKLNKLLASLNTYMDVVAQVNPQGRVGAQRILGIAAYVVKSNAKIAECTPESIISCIMIASMTGLDPNPMAGHIYFIPYRIKGVPTCTLQYGYKGEIQLIHRSGVVDSIGARAVYEGDIFKHVMGTKEEIIHEAGENYGDPAMVTDAYAFAYLKGSSTPIVERLNRKMIERLRKKNSKQAVGQYNQNGDPQEAWASDYDQMARKSAIRRLIEKNLPTSIEWNTAMMCEAIIPPSLNQFDRSGKGLSPNFQPEMIPQEPTMDVKSEVVQ